MRVGSREQDRLRTLVSAIRETIHQQSGGLESALARRHLESELLDAFFGALHSGCGSLIQPPKLRTSNRHQRLCQARNFIMEHARKPIGLEDISATLGLSHRGVENLFQDFLGIRPTAFLRHQRLHSVRAALRHTAPARGVVKRVALDQGFWHLGHFAREYRMLFGEYPNETLSRR